MATTGAPLHVLLTVASLAHVLVPYLIFVLIAHGLRQPWIALALVLAQVLCTRLTFYGIVLEANYLLSYPFLLSALVSGPLMRSRKPLVLVAVLAALFLVLLVHPVGFIAAVFVLVLLYLRGHTARPVLLALIPLSGVWPLIFRALFPPTAYEADLYASTGVGLEAMDSFFTLPGWRFLIDHTVHFTTHYVAFWVALDYSSTPSLMGGDAKYNADALKRLLDGEVSAYRNIVLANAAPALLIADKTIDPVKAQHLAAEAIDSGKAKKTLSDYIPFTNKAPSPYPLPAGGRDTKG